MKEFNLKHIREGKNLTVRQMAAQLDMSASQLSKIESGMCPPKLDDVVRIASAYGLQPGIAERHWIRVQARTSEAKDRIAVLLSRPEGEQTRQAIERMDMVSSLAGDPLLLQTARRLIEALVELKRRKLPRFRGGRVTKVKDAEDRDQYSPLQEKGKIESKKLFGVSRPNRFLIELHRVPERYGALHRQATTGDEYPGLEIFSVMAGQGILLRRENTGQWVWDDVKVGDSGFYAGGEDHCWLNPSASSPLILYAIFFPAPTRRPSTTSGDVQGTVEDKPGAWVEFPIDALPATLPQDLTLQVRQAMRPY